MSRNHYEKIRSSLPVKACGALIVAALFSVGCERLEAPAELSPSPEAPTMGASMSPSDETMANGTGGAPARPDASRGEVPVLDDEGSRPSGADSEPATSEPEPAADDQGTRPEPASDDEPVIEDPDAAAPEDLESADEPCVSFSDAVAPIIEAKCSACHNPGLPLADLNLAADWAYETLVNGVSAVTGSPFVVSGSPMDSYLMAKLGPTPPAGGQMPPAPNALSAEEVAAISGWITSGATLSCEPAPANEPANEGATHPLTIQVNGPSDANGNLRVALYQSYPSTEPPTLSETTYGALFPTEITFAAVPEGAYVAEVVFDTLPYDAVVIGAEDLLEKAAFTISAPLSLSVSFESTSNVAPGQGAPADDCEECAPGLICGAEPDFPGYCAGEPGSCGAIDAKGVCLSDTLVTYCVGEGVSSYLVSLDCTTNESATVCGQSASGAASCVQPSEPAPAEPEGACGDCAPGLICGQDPSLSETQCSGTPGTCEGLDYAGICLGDGVLLYCSNDSGSGTPLSVDCKLNEELSACGEISPGIFDCMAPSDVIEPEPEPEIESEDVDLAFELFSQVHPILEASCSGWLCHQYSGFAQPDLDKAYGVVQDKAFADNILDAIVEGRMPAGNFGLPLCTGDPSVDTDPKCLTQEELDLVSAWVALETGEGPPPPQATPDEEESADAQPPAESEAAVTFNDVHPILKAGCSGFFCHSGGLANDNIDVAFAAIEDKNLCESILDEVQSGSMPPGKGCTGDPALDAGKPDCLNAEEQAILSAWVLGGDEACAGPN